MPSRVRNGSTRAARNIKVAAILMPFAGIAFLWFIGVVRDGFGRYEDKFFSTVFIGSGLLFLAMMFVTMAVGAGLVTSNAVVDSAAHAEVATFGQMVLLALTKTYALRMAAVFMISLATIWLKTGLMPRWLVVVTYLVALAFCWQATSACGWRWPSRSGCWWSACCCWCGPVSSTCRDDDDGRLVCASSRQRL